MLFSTTARRLATLQVDPGANAIYVPMAAAPPRLLALAPTPPPPPCSFFPLAACFFRSREKLPKFIEIIIGSTSVQPRKWSLGTGKGRLRGELALFMLLYLGQLPTSAYTYSKPSKAATANER